MNKLFGYGRTRTRLSLILLSALAVLCIAMVSLCVFYNLNALATDNIAFANTVEDGLIQDNYVDISKFEYLSSLSSSTDFSSLDFGFYCNLPFTFQNNCLNYSLSDSSSFFLACKIPISSNPSVGYTLFEFRFFNSINGNATENITSFSLKTDGTLYTRGDWQGTDSLSFYNRFAKSTYRTSDYNVFGFYSTFTSDFSISNIYLADSFIAGFVPFVDNSYSPNGYDAGYDAGYADGLDVQYGDYYSSIYYTGYNDGYADGFEEGSSAFDQSADAVYDMRGHLALQFGLTQETFDENISYAYIAPTGSINQFFEYNGVYYGYSYVYISASQNNIFSATIEYNNSNGIPAWKVAERVSGTITIPYIYNNTYRLCVYAGDGFAPVFYSLTYPTIAVGEYSCFQIEIPTTSDIYIVGWNTTNSISVSGKNPYVFGFSPLGVYKYNNVSRQYSNGWRDGFNQGSQISDTSRDNIYFEGYQDGLLHANDYTFMGLLGSVFDAPVSALKGLLNYEILGVNLYDFILGLLSLAIILFVLRVFTRGL